MVTCALPNAVSFRAVEGMMLLHEGRINDETIRRWRQTSGQQVVNAWRRRRSRTGGDTWHRDEACLTINGETCCLWRTVSQDGRVVDVLAQRGGCQADHASTDDKAAVGPQVVITDKLKT